MSVLKKIAISTAAVAASAFLADGAIAVTVETLNGIYTANDRSTLLVEEVPVNDGQRLTLIIHDVELSVWRKRPNDVFRYRHNGCDLTIAATGRDRTKAFSIDATGHCTGRDAPFDGLSIRYDRSPQNTADSVPDRARKASRKTQRLSRNEIFELQFRFDQLGFEVGEPTGSLDGRAGRQTTAAVKAYGIATGTPGEMSEALLTQVREATKNIEGLVKGHGEIDFLVFTDQGTPLILAVEKIGRIYKDESQKITRDYDVDGSSIYSNVFTVSHVDLTLDIPLLAGVTFGYQVRVPAPPSGERLQINHVVVRPERLEDGSTKTSVYSYEHIYLKRESNPRYWSYHFEKKPSDRYKGDWPIRLENRGTVLLSRTFVLGTPAASAAGLQYQDLPALAKTYVENVRNSCKDYNPGGIPANKMSGIAPIALSDGTLALLIDNEALCSDHYSGANCSNRGCDVVVMIEADKGWKEIFHEHLYEKTFNIAKDRKLKSIAAWVYAGDPHCGAAPGSKFMSRDSCNVMIRYEDKNWVWKIIQ